MAAVTGPPPSLTDAAIDAFEEGIKQEDVCIL
jgi:hypothetical protein